MLALIGLALQQADGGWSLASLGTYKRHDKTDNAKDGPSDGYGTGFVVFVLRQAGVPADHDKIQGGVAWLKGQPARVGPLVHALAQQRRAPLHHARRVRLRRDGAAGL